VVAGLLVAGLLVVAGLLPGLLVAGLLPGLLVAGLLPALLEELLRVGARVRASLMSTLRQSLGARVKNGVRSARLFFLQQKIFTAGLSAHRTYGLSHESTNEPCDALVRTCTYWAILVPGIVARIVLGIVAHLVRGFVARFVRRVGQRFVAIMVSVVAPVVAPVTVPITVPIVIVVRGFVLRVVHGLVKGFADGFVSRRAVMPRQQRD
jgi:uncharacterized membrane protein YvlD (DUF360 family)